jgi:cyclic pyranopterin phosphate synthase
MAANLDPHNRRITYLRVSVTDRCDLRCIYCQPVQNLELLNHSDILSYEEIIKIIRAGTELGIRKVRLTGGEPLIRRNFLHLVRSVCRLPELEDVSISTNGVHLKGMAKEIFDAGVHRLNVSLDTLDRLKYLQITKRDHFDDVWEGLQEAESVGFSPIKINVVPMRGMNDNEVLQFAELSIRKPYHVRFIEYMPITNDTLWRSDQYVPSDEIRSKIEVIGPLQEVEQATLGGPAKRYRFESAKGEIGFISPLSQHFCASCNRLRLTADGKLRPCLLAGIEVDVKAPLRNGCSDGDLKQLFKEAIAKKPKRHHAGTREVRESCRPMSAIGG